MSVERIPTTMVHWNLKQTQFHYLCRCWRLEICSQIQTPEVEVGFSRKCYPFWGCHCTECYSTLCTVQEGICETTFIQIVIFFVRCWNLCPYVQVYMIEIWRKTEGVVGYTKWWYLIRSSFKKQQHNCTHFYFKS